jgi:hypothetical protein
MCIITSISVNGPYGRNYSGSCQLNVLVSPFARISYPLMQDDSDPFLIVTLYGVLGRDGVSRMYNSRQHLPAAVEV